MSDRIHAYEGCEPYLFVSYAHRNTEKVYPVIEALFADHFRVWYDEGIAPGSEWPKNIADHLRDAAGVIVFVSEESLASPNCENEVVNAKPADRSVFQFKLGEQSHPALVECKAVGSYEELRENLDDSFLGDGVTGYDRGVGTAKGGNFWTLIIAVAACLIVALGVGIYGLNDGWFDTILPGLAEVEVTENPQKEIVDTDNNAIVRGIVEQTNEELMREIDFKSDETREMLYQSIEFYKWGQETPLTYQNLTTCQNEGLFFQEANDELLEYMQYFPKLTELTVQSGDLTTLVPLLQCANLQIVQLTGRSLPVEIPENAPFIVQYIN